jgi:hypothetical protein
MQSCCPMGRGWGPGTQGVAEAVSTSSHSHSQGLTDLGGIQPNQGVGASLDLRSCKLAWAVIGTMGGPGPKLKQMTVSLVLLLSDCHLGSQPRQAPGHSKG